jgi:hypothetical protein
VHERLLTRHFLHRFVDNDLISPEADRHEVLSAVVAVLVSSTLFATVLLSAKYLFLPFPSPARVAFLAVQDRFFFVTLTMAVMGLVAVAVWDALVLDARDHEILGSLPVPRRSLVLAKSAAVLLLAAGFVIAVTAVPTVVHPILMAGQLQIGVGSLIALSIAHAAVTALAGAFTFMTVLAVREVGRAVLGDHLFGRISGPLQGLLLTAFATTLLVLPALPAAVVYRALVVDPSLLYFIPPAWFVGLLEAITGGTIADLPYGDLPPAILALEQRASVVYQSARPLLFPLVPLAVGAAASVFLVAPAAYVWNARRSPVLPATMTRTSRPRYASVACWAVQRVIVRRSVAQAGFFFTLRCLWRSLPHRLSLGAAGAVGVAVSVVGLYSAGGMRDELTGEVVASVFATQPLMLIALLLGFRHAARLPAALPASWVFRLAFSGDHRSYRTGVRRAVTGAPGRTRTCDPRLRRPMLYPPELRARAGNRLILAHPHPAGLQPLSPGPPVLPDAYAWSCRRVTARVDLQPGTECQPSGRRAACSTRRPQRSMTLGRCARGLVRGHQSADAACSSRNRSMAPRLMYVARRSVRPSGASTRIVGIARTS